MPLEPVAPLPSPFTPPPTRAAESGNSAPLLIVGIAAVVLLGVNGIIGWNLSHTQREQERRLARLEETAFSGHAGSGTTEGDSPGGRKLPRQATADARLAALLAVAGDADRCRRLLDSLSPAQCAQLAQALIARPAASDRNAALAAVVNYLAANDPSRAAGLLDAVQEPVLRTTLARELVDTWIASHPDDAVRWLTGDGARFLNPTAASAPVVRAIAQWSSFDPAGAAKFAAGLAMDRGPVSRALFLASRAWGQLDPTAALAWVDTLPMSDPKHGQALSGVWEGWTERDPTGAGTALRQQLDAAANRPPVELAGTIGRQWAQTDPAGAAQWAQNLPGGARRAALAQVARAWTQADTPGAARWAATLPASETRAAIWQEIVDGWADNDPDAAGTWLGGLPLGRDHDAAVAAYLPKVEPTAPERALAWAATVSNPEVRADQVQRVLGAWEQRDPGAARNWAAANAVSILPPRAAGP